MNPDNISISIRQQMKNETDDNLLLNMATRSSDHDAEAKEAWAEFYRRYSKALYSICLKRLKNYKELKIVSENDRRIEDLVSDTFLKVYEKAHTFKSNAITDQQKLRNRILGWLMVIAENLLKESFRGRTGIQIITLEDEEWEYVEERSTTPLNTRKLQLIEDAMLTLSEKEQDIIRITLLYYKPGEDSQALPSDVLADLCKVLGMTDVNLRQIRSRAYRKIREYLQSKL